MHDQIPHGSAGNGAALHARAIAEARRILGAGRIAAFSSDVFDTFLLRRCADPTGVYERAFALSGIANKRPGMAALFVEQRRIAEAKARKAALVSRGSPEVRVADIYACFPLRLFGLSSDAAESLAEAEFQAERELCFVNPEIRDLLAEAREAGISVGFISDTYWDDIQLSDLLAECAPGFGWDFLFPSCVWDSGKSGTLFDIYLKERGLTPDAALHIGDNPGADVKAAARRGIAAVHYPQADGRLTHIFMRETALFDQISQTGRSRLDGGLRTLRRAVEGALPDGDPAFSWGMTVLGPVFAAFDRFVADRVAALRAEGRSVAVACVARDGLLPFQVWRQTRADPISYIEVNRRTSLIAGAESGSMGSFFKRMGVVDNACVAQFLKGDTPQIRRFFKRTPNGLASGAAFAAELPKLVDAATRRRIGRQARKALFAHLEAAIPDLAEATDLVLVDLGYSGTVQKGLRNVFALANRPQRLHGLYLLSVDEDLAEIAEPDTAEGFLSGLALPPIVRRAVLANIALLEQMCGAPEGSVMDYAPDGTVRRESDPRPPEQTAIGARARDGALAFARTLHGMVRRGLPDPFDAPESVDWTARILARALLLPTDSELAAFGGLQHDVNLGTRALVPMADPGPLSPLMLAKPLPSAFKKQQPPMWMAGSFAAVSPVHGFLYMLAACEKLCPDTFGEADVCATQVFLFKRGNMEQCLPVDVKCTRTEFGELRIRALIPAKADISSVMIPAAALPPRSLIRGVTLQQIEAAAERLLPEAKILSIPTDTLQGAGMRLQDDILTAEEGETGYLMIPLPQLDVPAAVLTLAIAPLDGLRLLAAESTLEETELA